MHDVVGPVKGKFLNAKSRLLTMVSATPQDRLNWSPSPTSRSVIQIVGHAAMSIRNLTETFEGRTFAIPTPVAAEAHFREEDKTFTSLEQVLALLDQHSSTFIAFLDSLTPERLGTMVTMPFAFGEMPMSIVIDFPAQHTIWHEAQIEYLQTIYGDHDWHM